MTERQSSLAPTDADTTRADAGPPDGAARSTEPRAVTDAGGAVAADAAGGKAEREATPDAGRPARRAGWRSVLFAALAYLAAAVGVTWRGWADPSGVFLGTRPGDQSFNEWMLAFDAHATTHLDNPFFTTLQNAPDGVNLMTNVGMQLPGLLLTPVTVLGGAALSYLVFITLNLAATALAWYVVLARHVVTSRVAAFVGGLVLAFAPALVSHSNGHPHITAQWLVPFLLWQVVRLTRPGHTVRDGLVLGVLVVAQFYIGLEILFLVAVGCALAALAYLLFTPRRAVREAPRTLGGLAVAGALVAVATAYPLWMQFAGPQHRTGHPGEHDVYALKLASFAAFATRTVFGGDTKGLVANTTEEASFFGLPALLLALVAVVALWRVLAVRILAVVGVLTALLSQGSTWTWGRDRTDVPAPFALLAHLPVFDSMVIARFALITTVALGLLLTIWLDRVLAATAGAGGRRVPLRLAAGVALAGALLPMVPTPLPTQARPPVPAFVTSGAWRAHVTPGRTLVPVPVDNLTSIRWGAAAAVGFAVPQGYFLGPTSPTDSTGRWGVQPRPTATLLTRIAVGARGTAVSAADREQALADARHWKADALVLPVDRPRAASLRIALDACYGPGSRVDDVWVWDVRPVTR
ncbi:hypothetical protein [Micromonospora siamensis]|uniref:DUF6311 domain-containing protein n=1 Tax=Micromonospora siamensis TaxID=299152 RepID=A0A1C5HYS3_9ACTN|nr:hypothetical protein [Micromonospora siamensis]SCG51168.1 hypothetical protein GA0074704_2601 [Micromonospora siamensis]